MINQAQAGYATFQPRARLLRLIGAELISDEVVALTELVKNAHDADASKVTLEFHDVTKPDGYILVRDDGCGMDLQTVLGRWMQPAGTDKRAPKGRITPKGRRVLGEKGVGRFAADKLARRLELVTRCPRSKEVKAFFDWDQFDSDSLMLSDIKSRWQVADAREIDEHGTLLRLIDLRAAWNERMFRRLSTRLSRLLAPSQKPGDFTICMESNEFPQYSGELRREFLERAPYQIEAQFDGRNAIQVKINGSVPLAHLWNGSGDLECGPVKIRLHAFDLEFEALRRIGPRMEVRAWLREWSGISIYRDNFRVWPYGEPFDDWLRLDQRRVNNPVVRLSNNQIVGFVEISRDKNPLLFDQTSREGLLQGRAFEDLRRLLYFVLQILEADRQAIRHPVAHKPQKEQSGSNVNGGSASTLLEMLAAGNGKDENGTRRQLARAYSELASLGQAACGIAEGLRSKMGDVRDECARLRAIISLNAKHDVTCALHEIEHSLLQITTHMGMLDWIHATGGDRRRFKDRRRSIDVIAELNGCREAFKPLLATRKAEMKVRCKGDSVQRVMMLPEVFRLLVHTFLTNTLEWIPRGTVPRFLATAIAMDEWCEIKFSDNGPGIPPAIAQKVFEPLFTRKENGGGMGLTIARDVVNFHGGSVSVLRDPGHRGTIISLMLPRRQSRATVHRH